MSKRAVFLMLISSLLFLFAQTRMATDLKMEGPPIAFPDAEGFGKYTIGGRGGRTFIVSNLNDSGPGSLRDAVESKEPLIIVFSVSGIIHLTSPLSIRANKTIAGQSAPGDGICITDYPVIVVGDNVIIRFLRFRLGDRFQNKGKVPGSGHDDAFSASRRKKLIVDHCSFSWSTDECISVYGGDSTTLQWNLVAEPLNYSYHFEEGDTDFEKHGFGGIWGGRHLSAHHNMFAHCVSRNPRFNGARLGSSEELVDFRNNIIYNWGSNSVYGGEGGNYNIVNNYYKYGPSTNPNVKFRIVNPSKNSEMGFGKFYVNGNYVDGSDEVTRNNDKGVDMGGDAGKSVKKESLVSTPFSVVNLPDITAKAAFYAFIKEGGCSLPIRDTLDQRILRNLFERNGRIVDVQGGYPHGSPYESTMVAWPTLRTKPANTDSDADGMPDAWEVSKGLNPHNADDATRTTIHSFYTNLEMYLNSLVK